MKPADICQVTVTIDDREAALTLARAAVSGRLAACGQVAGPIRSVYRWQGAIEESDEWVIIFKTTFEGYQNLARFIKERHPYDVPEILCAPVAEGNPDYLAWVADSID